MLPGYLTWHGHREFDVGAEPARLALYSIVLSQGARADLARYVNAGWLADDWPRLAPLLGRRTRRVAERRFDLALCQGRGVSERGWRARASGIGITVGRRK